MSEALVVERDGRVATIINNDAPRNRMTLEFIDQLETTIPEIEKDKSIGAVVIRGAGEEHFSVGMNLKQFSEGAKAKGSIFGMLDQRLRVIRKIELSTKPWIATMYGYCLGGGLELPLGCHFRLAARGPRPTGSASFRKFGRTISFRRKHRNSHTNWRNSRRPPLRVFSIQ